MIRFNKDTLIQSGKEENKVTLYFITRCYSTRYKTLKVTLARLTRRFNKLPAKILTQGCLIIHEKRDRRQYEHNHWPDTKKTDADQNYPVRWAPTPSDKNRQVHVREDVELPSSVAKKSRSSLTMMGVCKNSLCYFDGKDTIFLLKKEL